MPVALAEMTRDVSLVQHLLALEDVTAAGAVVERMHADELVWHQVTPLNWGGGCGGEYSVAAIVVDTDVMVVPGKASSVAYSTS